MEGAYQLEEWRKKMRSMTSEFIEVDDILRQTSKSLAPHRKRKRTLSVEILDSMTKAGVDACNISGRDDKLVVKTRKKKTSLKDVLPSRLEKFFENEPGRCEECLNFLMEPEVTEVPSLCRVTKKKRKADEDEDAGHPEAEEEAEEEGEEEEEEEEED